MLMKTCSMNDATLLLVTGFHTPDGVNVNKLATFCGVTERTAYRWLKYGLPARARTQLDALFCGDYLPAEWRRLGMQICKDGVYVGGGQFIPLKTLHRLPFILQAVNWSLVPA